MGAGRKSMRGKRGSSMKEMHHSAMGKKGGVRADSRSKKLKTKHQDPMV